MKMIIFCSLGFLFAATSCRKHSAIIPVIPQDSQIIANHTIIKDFEKIPPQYLEEVKKMMVFFPGESHSEAYREGMKLLQEKYPAFTCNIAHGEAYTENHLRVNQGSSIGEAEWFTWYAYSPESRPSSGNVIKDIIKEYHENGHPISVIGFGWCWDLYSRRSRLIIYRERLSGHINFWRDRKYGVYWRGSSKGGPDGNREWGLDSSDYDETANRVNADTYLSATEDYIAFCKSNGISTKVVFTTGPADSRTGEDGYQGYLKHQYIRNYVASDPSRILFDYNDILCHDDDGRTDARRHKFPQGAVS